MVHTFLKIAILMLIVMIWVPATWSETGKEQNQDQEEMQRELERVAAIALSRLKKSLKENGFYITRIALNVWRTTAIDAGNFDQAQYDELKKQLYEKSVNDSMKCFEYFLQEDDYYDANICLQTWRIHSKELGTFDKAEYDVLKTRLISIRKKTSPGKPK